MTTGYNLVLLLGPIVRGEARGGGAAQLAQVAQVAVGRTEVILGESNVTTRPLPGIRRVANALTYMTTSDFRR